MPEKILYEYAVIRLLPKVEREEFLNVGVMIYAKSAGQLLVRTHLDEGKFGLFSTELSVDEVQKNLQSFEWIAAGVERGGPIGRMDLASRFRWMTAVRSSCLQTSRPHLGFTTDLDKTLDRLFEELVK